LYRKKVTALGSLLDGAEHRDDVMALIRSRIEGIVLTPQEEGASMRFSTSTLLVLLCLWPA
jgi:hypothetical protein